MKHLIALIVALATAVLPQSAHAQAAGDLAQPPDNAETWAIVTGGVRRGVLSRWTTPDGAHWSRESISVRSFVSDIDQQQAFAPDGTLQSLSVRGGSTFGDGEESFAVAGGRYRYQSAADRGEGTYPAGAYYLAVGGTFDTTMRFLDALRAAPDHSLRLLPSGVARLVELATHEVSDGAETRSLTAYAVTGVGLAPLPVWYEGDHFFAAAADFLSYVRPGWEPALEELAAVQNVALAQRSALMVEEIAPRLTHPVLFRDVRLYDSIRRRFRDHQSVLVDDGRIVAVGNVRRIRAPADAQIIQGGERTLVPGLWDSHQHFSSDETGPLLLAQGITSIRDPGDNPAELAERRRRIEDGQLLGPRIVPSLMINGGGDGGSGGMAVIARSLDEALAAVRRARDEGYFAVKIYAGIPPAWVAPMAAEAHRLGLHVHGHVPNGMRPLEAVRAGYDEIAHILFVMTQVLPQDVVDSTSALERYYGIARYAPDVDLHGPVMSRFLDELRRRHIVVDPTLVAWELGYVPEPGEIGAAYAPFIGTMPPQVERSYYSGGLPPTEQVSRARMRQGQAALQALVGELHRRDIAIVAGTDGAGLELVRELELYVAAGMTPADALAAATIVPSRHFGAGAETGSITVGKEADLFLVDGDPSSNIADLRNVVVVMRDGRLMQAADLRRAVGISGPPHAAP